MTDDNDRLNGGTLPRDPKSDSVRILPVSDTADGADEPAAYKPFPISALPRVIRDYVEQASKAIGCDTTFVILPLLAAIAAAVGNTMRVKVKRGWTEPLIIWSAIIGESGTHKTPAFAAALTAIRDWQSQAFASHKKEMQAYKDRLAAREGGGRRRRVRFADSSDETPPVAQRIIANDTTVEALSTILGQNPRGMLLDRDELSGWFASFDQYRKGGRGSDASHYLEMHQTGSLTVDRKSADGPVHVPKASLSIAGGIQPAVLRQSLACGHLENGLAARFLMAMPSRAISEWTEAEIPESSSDAIRKLFDRLLAIELMVDANGNPQSSVIPMSGDAKALWVQFYNRHAARRSTMTGELAAAFSKLEAYAARLALLFYAVDQAVAEAEQPFAPISESQIRCAIEVVDWFCDETVRIYAALQLTRGAASDNRARSVIAKRGGAVTRRELRQATHRYREDPAQILTDLAALEAAGEGAWFDRPAGARGGRPTREFRLVDPDQTTSVASSSASPISGHGTETPDAEGAYTGQAYDA